MLILIAAYIAYHYGHSEGRNEGIREFNEADKHERKELLMEVRG
jgi:hypothetical protein